MPVFVQEAKYHECLHIGDFKMTVFISEVEYQDCQCFVG